MSGGVEIKIDGLNAIEEWIASEYETYIEETEREVISAFGDRKQAEENSDAEPGDL